MLPANKFATTAMLFGGLMLTSLTPSCSQRMEMEQCTSPMAAIQDVYGFDLWDVKFHPRCHITPTPKN